MISVDTVDQVERWLDNRSNSLKKERCRSISARCIGILVHVIATAMLVLTLLAGCGKAESTETAALPTDTPSPTNTPMPPIGASAASEAQPPLSSSRVIAFFSDRDGNEEIYIMNADGSDQKRLTHNDAEDEFPT